MAYSKDTIKGKFTPKHPDKYRGDVTGIVFRSSYELKFMNWCDTNPNILQWASEEIVIPYFNPVDKKMHRYFVDFAIVVQETPDTVQKYLVEVKPERFTKAPPTPKRRSRRFLTESMQWVVNTAKWDAARKVATDNGWRFLIVTERDLGITR
jgi:hypothetical protein